MVYHGFCVTISYHIQWQTSLQKSYGSVESWRQIGYNQVKRVTMGVDFWRGFCYNAVYKIKSLEECLQGGQRWTI